MKKSLFLIFFNVIYLANLFALQISGTVISDNEKVITSRYMGFVKEVNVNEGDFVKKGDILFSIESSSLDSKKEQVKLTLQMQENNYNNLKINYERYKRLYSKDLVPKYEVEQFELKLNNLKKMINISKVKLKELYYQYRYLNVTAPNSGLIIKKTIKSSEMFMPAMPAMILSDFNALKILLTLPESSLSLVKIGTKVDVEIASLKLQTKGQIVSIIPHIKNSSHSFKVKIAFDKKKMIVYPGMYATIKLMDENE